MIKGEFIIEISLMICVGFWCKVNYCLVVMEDICFVYMVYEKWHCFVIEASAWGNKECLVKDCLKCFCHWDV